MGVLMNINAVQIKANQLLARRKNTSHFLHLILSLITIGGWVPIWILVAVSNGIENWKIDRKIDKLMEYAE